MRDSETTLLGAQFLMRPAASKVNPRLGTSVFGPTVTPYRRAEVASYAIP